MPVIGLTGGIGSGKSTVAAQFARLGAAVIDTDLIARHLVEPGEPALAEIRSVFSDAIIDAEGRLDRAALRRRVFNDAIARAELEAILHPRIRQAVRDALEAVDAPYALVVVPLLVETRAYDELLDRVLVVDCPETLQVKRVMARNGLSRDEVEAIMASQATRAERLAAADDIIDNAASPEALERAVAVLHAQYSELGQCPP